MQVLVIEPYYSGSHRAWADGLCRHSTHDATLLTHPGSFWRWRLRGAAVTLAAMVDEHVAARGAPDVVLASDMLNLPALLGLCRRTLGGLPVVLYLHENQLAHPLGPNQQPDEALALVNWASLAAADEIWVNSHFQCEGLAETLPALLRRAPDRSHVPLLDGVLARLRVVPVGVELADIPQRATERPVPAEPRVLWNHRWDHDKNPQAVFEALAGLAAEGLAFRLSVLGENERVDPREFSAARRALGDRIDHFGFVDRQEYAAVLGDSDVVVSAAHHEFFGISVIEAVAAGAVPVLPDRLSYPEVIPPRYHQAALYGSGGLTARLRDVLGDVGSFRRQVAGLDREVRRFDWPVVIGQYDEGLDRVADRYGPLP